jgi:putative ABC transport system substrate-binding protein
LTCSLIPSGVACDTIEAADDTLYRIAIEPAASSIAVIYPDIGEPYRSVFSKIIQGVEDKTRSRVASIAVGADVNLEGVASELRRQNVRVVIALGRHGLEVASGLPRDIAVVAGGVMSAPDTKTRAVSVLSMAPDPELLFERLKVFAPGIRRVVVVYDPSHNAWLMRLAQEAARSVGLELVTYEAHDLKAAVRCYQQIFASANPKRDAMWLPQDPTSVEESSVLPLVLQESWNRSLVVFSSNLAHVRRGALFALYPDNFELGRKLASSALTYLSSGDPGSRGLVPLENVLLAVNVRAAGHLGIRVSDQQARSFDLVFPER